MWLTFHKNLLQKILHSKSKLKLIPRFWSNNVFEKLGSGCKDRQMLKICKLLDKLDFLESCRLLQQSKNFLKEKNLFWERDGLNFIEAALLMHQPCSLWCKSKWNWYYQLRKRSASPHLVLVKLSLSLWLLWNTIPMSKNHPEAIW